MRDAMTATVDALQSHQYREVLVYVLEQVGPDSSAWAFTMRMSSHAGSLDCA